MDQYLKETHIINWSHPGIRTLAATLAEGCTSPAETAKKCFEWVRDNIYHSWDFKQNPVTYIASDVLKHATGYCYAKSHLLCALLRANQIPAGFCYQRLSIEDTGPPYCLHGLNAVFLDDYGWYRIDARGNKPDVNAQFSPPLEQLAFSATGKQAADFYEIWPDPLDIVITVLEKSHTYRDVYDNLPDIEIISIHDNA
ncbi:MAG: Cro/Cl family transcriptional regulator [Deltaproteobacteria bacterium]|nr:MAG: Cro/Cl family transcriptional regulator [Deltaproteobacteria bacterium]